jgi:hypothetical protein
MQQFWQLRKTNLNEFNKIKKSEYYVEKLFYHGMSTENEAIFLDVQVL